MRSENTPSPRWQKRHVLFWLLVAGIVGWWRGPAFRLAFEPNFYPRGGWFFQPDFFQEWASARNRFNDLPIYASHAITLERYVGIRPNTADRYFIAVNAHPPTSVLLAIPLAGLDFADALPLWNLLSLLALVASAALIVHQLDLPFSFWDLLPAVTILLLCYPFQHQMVQGQLNLVLLLLITGAWAADRSAYPIVAGVLVALATAIKLYPGFLFLYFVLRGRWRSVTAGSLAFVSITALTALVLGPQAYADYFLRVLPGTSLWRGDWHNLSLSGLWFKLFDPRKQLPPVEIHPLLWSSLLAWMGMATSAAALVFALYRIVPRVSSLKDADLAFALCIVAMLLVSPITWDHYLLLLILPLCILWRRLPPGSYGREVFIVSIFILCWEPMMVAEHGLILLDAARSRSGEWIATPWEILTALSIICYAMITIFVLGWREYYLRGNRPSMDLSAPER
jgi:hypothetical protein